MEEVGHSLRLGATGKIRYAKIEMVQGDKKEGYANLGFVPLLYFAFDWDFYQDWKLFFDADFAAAKQGRAIDAALKVRRDVGSEYFVGAGARTLEGGAENKKVVTFSWFNFALIEFGYRY